MSTRQVIADAINEVPGCRAFPYFKQASNPGHSYVRLDRVEYPNPFGGIYRWNVVVVLPQDIAAAEQWVETNLSLLIEALKPTGYCVTDVAMQRLGLDSGELSCVFINGHTEEV